MQGVSELVEHRCHLVPSEQRGLTLWRLGTVTHIEDDRQLLSLAALLLEAVHPRSTTLRRATEIVAIEESLLLTVLVDDFEDLHIRMVRGDVGALLKGQTVDTVGGIEHTVEQDAVDIEVGFYLVVRDV